MSLVQSINNHGDHVFAGEGNLALKGPREGIDKVSTGTSKIGPASIVSLTSDLKVNDLAKGDPDGDGK